MRIFTAILILVLALIFWGCSGSEKQDKTMHPFENFELNIQFFPPYCKALNIRITSIDGSNYISLNPIYTGNSCIKDFKSLTLQIPENLFNEFLEEFKKINIRNIKSNYEICVCEIISGRITYNNFIHNKKIIDFSTGKPDPGIEKILSLVTELALELFISDPYSRLTENVARNICYRKSFRVINTEPLVIRIYNLSNDKDLHINFYEELDSVLNKVSQNELVIFDFSNLYTCNLKKYNYLKNYLKRPNSFVLVQNDTCQNCEPNNTEYEIDGCCDSGPEEIIGYLLSIGIDKEILWYSYEGIINKINPEYNFIDFIDVSPATLKDKKFLNDK